MPFLSASRTASASGSEFPAWSAVPLLSKFTPQRLTICAPARYNEVVPMRTDEFDYLLPDELIAQTPVPRGESRLLVLHRASGKIERRRFSDFVSYLHPGDTLVVNDSRVTARRLA